MGFLDNIYNKQKDFFRSAQKKAESTVNDAYKKQKEILRSAQDQSEQIINTAYETQKDIIRKGQEEVEKNLDSIKKEIEDKLKKGYNSAISVIYDKIVSYLDKGNWWMKALAKILKSLKDTIIKGIQK